MTGSHAAPPGSPLAQPVRVLHGVGPEREAQLARLEIHTVEDLLLHPPRRYEDRRRPRRISELQLHEAAAVQGKVVALGVKWFARHTKSIFELIVDDGTARLHCRWWNQPYQEKNFAAGQEVIVFGKPVGLKPRTMDHPETEVIDRMEEESIHMNRVTPVYPLTEGLGQRWLRSLIWRTLDQFEGKIPEPWALPEGCRRPRRARAIRMLHFPQDEGEPAAARERLALDEFVELQRKILARRRLFQTRARALPCGGNNRLIKPFLARLGFKLTDAQTRVLRELRRDLSGEFPMRRLLQGDVGSGKTAVAACCALMTIESGYAVALMAPTEILAEQHYLNFSGWFRKLDPATGGVAVELLTGSRKTVGARGTAAGNPGPRPPALYVGTHALIESGVEIDNLGLVIIDEQHKFGVAQRERLVRKGRYPHLLVMTATPIPRTLGLTLYGDLDLSVMDQLPPGRGRMLTFVRTVDKLPKVWEFLCSQFRAGRQAYVVYPRVEEEDPAAGVKAVVKEFETVSRALAPFRAGLLHGRIRPAEKEQVMADFRAGRLQALLATSLIEVGVDVPNANVMVIENAEHFGLAQLHQLRGRIGRGAHESYCILVAGSPNQEARRRLRVLERTSDGFEIAEADLQLRGPGELLGRQQSGLPRFRFANLATDLALAQEARPIAAVLAGGSP